MTVSPPFNIGADAATPPAFMGVEPWCAFSGMSRRTTYEKLGSGELRAVKLGSKTLIDVPHGLGYLRSLPTAKIRPAPTRHGERKSTSDRGAPRAQESA